MPWRRSARGGGLDAAWDAFALGLRPPYELNAALATALDGLSELISAPAYYAYRSETKGGERTLRATRAAAGTPEVGPNYAGLVTGAPLPQVPIALPSRDEGAGDVGSVTWERTRTATPLCFIEVTEEVTLAALSERAPSTEVRERLSRYAARIGPVIGLLCDHRGEVEARLTGDLRSRTQEQATGLALDVDRLLGSVARIGERALGATDGYAAIVGPDGMAHVLWQIGEADRLYEVLPPGPLVDDPSRFRAALWRAPGLPDGWSRLEPVRPECAAVVGRSAGLAYVAAYALGPRRANAVSGPGPEMRLTTLAETAERVLSRRASSLQAASIHLDTLRVLARLLDAMDSFDGHHHARVATLATDLAREMGLGAAFVADLRMAGEVHDVGMVASSLGLGPDWAERVLRDEERQVLRDHPVIGAGVLATLPESVAGPRVAWAVRHHHERFDGTGYPEGLSGEGIPLEARILALAEVFVARTTARAYRPAMDEDRALNAMRQTAGREVDPQVVAALERVLGRRRAARGGPGPV